MKKCITMIVASILMVATMATTAMAATDSYTDRDISVRAGTEMIGSNASKLVIEKSDDHTQDLIFNLHLNNATWLYSGETTIAPGLKCTVLTSTQMIVAVDFAIYDPVSNNIVIPLEAKIESAGVAQVTISSSNSTVSSATHSFAHVNYPGMAITLTDVDGINGTFGLTFKDDYPYSMAKGRLFKLTLSNGFTFVSADKVEGTGKYLNVADFTIDSKDKKIAYVTLEGTALSMAGTIKVSGIQTVASEKTGSVTTNLYVEPVYGEGGGLSFHLENFKSVEIVKDGTPILFQIGKTGYLADEEAFETDVAPFIDTNGRTMLPLRALANAFNISDEDIKWDDATKTVRLMTRDGKEILVKVGSTELRVGVARVSMDTRAVIKEGRTYLPMRAVLNALGVADDDIIWDNKEKTVLVYYK